MILFIGVLVYVFYLYNQPPVFHNQVLKERAMKTEMAVPLEKLDHAYNDLYAEKRKAVDVLTEAVRLDDQQQIEESSALVKALQGEESLLRDSVKRTIAAAIPGAKTQDRDYIFLNFVLTHLPHGIIGLLLAVMFSAAMSSMASELSALASTTSVDIYKRSIKPNADPIHFLKASRYFTVLWALLAMAFAMLASFAENLIQFVNIVGSLFYGTILGIFLTAFYIKRVSGTPVFIAALLSEAIVFYCHFYSDVAYLLYNIIGCFAVIILSLLFEMLRPKKILS
jgi:Na+(H+)/acetate symporter ActP